MHMQQQSRLDCIRTRACAVCRRQVPACALLSTPQYRVRHAAKYGPTAARGASFNAHMGTAAGQAELRSLENEVATFVEQDWSKLPGDTSGGVRSANRNAHVPLLCSACVVRTALLCGCLIISAQFRSNTAI